jgi:hypothetical protein
VAFVKGGNNVDDTHDVLEIIKRLAISIQAMVDAMLYFDNAINTIEQRVKVLEND